MSRSVVCFRKSGFSLSAVLLGFAVAASGAFAQSTAASTQYSPSYSSSSSSDGADGLLAYNLPNAPTSGQNSGGYGNGGYHQYSRWNNDTFHHIAIEAGAGFDAPLGSTGRAQGWGYNIKLGGGWNFNKKFGVLLEYEFNRTGVPDNVLAAVAAEQDINDLNGSVHIWGFSLDPIFYYKTTGSWGGYVTGGAGFYRKLTNFSTPVYLGYGCDYFYGCYPQYSNVTVSHFSSNQAGLNFGTGFTHNIGNGAKIYAEARYLFVNSPNATATAPGSGTVSMIPVTFGIRF